MPDVDALLEDPVRTDRLDGHHVDPSNSAGQGLLAAAYVTHGRPLCGCRPVGVPMYIAKVGARLVVKRMSDTGSLHATSCGSYAPEDLCGLGHVLGDAVRIDPDTGLTLLRLGFRLSMGERDASDIGGPTLLAGSVVSSGQRLSLLCAAGLPLPRG